MSLLPTALLFLACGTSPAAPPDERRPPNFLLLVADDMGPTDLGFLGSEIRTPNLDALARDGLVLSRFLVSPACSPTRAMLLTGRDAHAVGLGTMAGEARGTQVGAPGYEGVLSTQVETIARLLQQAGYHTSLSGKWHLGGQEDHLPGRRGFERWFGIAGGGSSHFADAVGLTPPGDPVTYYLDDRPVTLPDDFFSTRDYTDRLIQFIDEAVSQRRPFFGLAAYTAPHWPLQVPDDWLDRYAGVYDGGYDELHHRRHAAAVASGLVPAGATAPPPTPFALRWDGLGAEHRPLETRRMEIYAAMVENLDHHIGRLLAAIDRRGESENTVVLFFSDNGPEGNPVGNLAGIGPWVAERFDNSLGNMGRAGSYVWPGPAWAQPTAAPFRWFKTFPTEGGTRTPAILRGPVVRRGRSDALVSVRDIAPTLLEMAGLPVPPAMTGRSLGGLLAGLSETVYEEDQPIAVELFGRRAVWQGRWKATWLWPPYGPGGWELFDLARDPGEQHDLAAAEPQRLAELVGAWEAYSQTHGVVRLGFDASYAMEPARDGTGSLDERP